MPLRQEEDEEIAKARNLAKVKVEEKPVVICSLSKSAIFGLHRLVAFAASRFGPADRRLARNWQVPDPAVDRRPGDREALRELVDREASGRLEALLPSA
jgi:hypothetical protein